MNETMDILVLPGDGIGPEITAATEIVLRGKSINDAVSRLISGLKISGSRRYTDTEARSPLMFSRQPNDPMA